MQYKSQKFSSYLKNTISGSQVASLALPSAAGRVLFFLSSSFQFQLNYRKELEASEWSQVSEFIKIRKSPYVRLNHRRLGKEEKNKKAFSM